MYTEANTCLYMVKWVYTRRQTRLHEKANTFALYLASDLYCSALLRPLHFELISLRVAGMDSINEDLEIAMILCLILRKEAAEET